MANELILVVEDNEMSRKLVRDVLTVKGYTIVEAETGEEGVRLAQKRHPDLVLMDIRLPGIDGIQALGRLRAEVATRTIPVMAGFDAFESKPINLRDFLAAVERLLERHRK